MASSNRIFKNACDILDIVECSESPGKRYTDPCNCYDTYYCLNYEVRKETCAQGTAFDGEICDHENTVLFKDCNVNQPWLRCNVSDSRLNELINICGGTTSTQVQTTSDILTEPSPTDKPAGDNLGLIIGLVVAGVIVFVILVILFVLIWRRKKANDKIERDRPGTVLNPEYFESRNRDDPYATIDDSRHTPMSIGSNLAPITNTATRNGSLHGGTLADTLPPNLDTVYDNSASRDDLPAGYERTGNTLKPGGSEPPYLTLTRENNTDPGREDIAVKPGESEPKDFTLTRQDNGATESNNNTPKYHGRNQHNVGVFSSVVDDSAIQVDRHATQSDTQTFEDDSPYKGAKF